MGAAFVLKRTGPIYKKEIYIMFGQALKMIVLESSHETETFIQKI
jgi:hypothetical protein